MDRLTNRGDFDHPHLPFSSKNHDDTIQTSDLWNVRLPTEVLLRIFGFCDLRTLAQAGMVCRTWTQVQRTKSLWQRFVDRQCLPLNPLPEEYKNPTIQEIMKFNTVHHYRLFNAHEFFTVDHVQKKIICPPFIFSSLLLSQKALSTDRMELALYYAVMTKGFLPDNSSIKVYNLDKRLIQLYKMPGSNPIDFESIKAQHPNINWERFTPFEIKYAVSFLRL